jgi:hypothetical protein
MWQVTGTQTSASWLALEPFTVLYDFDGPRIFTCKDSSGNLFLAYQCGEDNQTMRFLVVPFSEESERKLTSGEDSLHDVLMRPHAWLFDLDFQWQIIGAWQVRVENLPTDCVPSPGVMLWSHLPSRIKAAALRACATETKSLARFDLPFALAGAA